MHVLALLYEGTLHKQQEIGLTTITMTTPLFTLEKTAEVYELHNFYATSPQFTTLAHSEKCPQIIQHSTKPFYGVLFHPEVRNKALIKAFATNAS